MDGRYFILRSHWAPGANFPAFSPFPDIIFYTNNEFHQEQLVGPLLIT